MSGKVRVRKEIQRTRGVVVEVDIDKDSMWIVSIEDFLKNTKPEDSRAGTEVSVRLHQRKDGKVTTWEGLSRIPGAAWPALQAAVDKVIEEFKQSYPESPQ